MMKMCMLYKGKETLRLFYNVPDSLSLLMCPTHVDVTNNFPQICVYIMCCYMHLDLSKNFYMLCVVRDFSYSKFIYLSQMTILERCMMATQHKRLRHSDA